jgi:hypothetical protein
VLGNGLFQIFGVERFLQKKVEKRKDKKFFYVRALDFPHQFARGLTYRTQLEKIIFEVAYYLSIFLRIFLNTFKVTLSDILVLLFSPIQCRATPFKNL